MPVPRPHLPLKGLSIRVTRPVVWGLLVLLAIGYVAAAVYLYRQQDALIYPGVLVNEDTLHPLTENFRRLTLNPPDGTVLHGLVALPRNSQPLVSPTLLLVFGGNAQDAPAFALSLRNRLHADAPLHVAAFNYRGYHSAAIRPSTGQAGQAALLADAIRVYDAAVAEVRPARVYLLGYSLGTAVASHLATERPAAGLILVAPFAGMARMASAQYPWLAPVIPLLLRSPLDTEEMLGRTSSVPVTIFHTRTDGLIPQGQADILARAAGSHLREISAISGTTHSTIIRSDDFMQRLSTVLNEPIP